MNTSETSQRRWGPFSGRQLTVMVVALMVGLVLLPSTVWAVTTVSGTVHAIPASPTNPFSFTEDIDSAQLTRVVGPTASAINLSALSLSPKDAPNGPADFYLYVGSQPSAQATCNQNISFTLYHVPSVQVSPVFVQSFSTPLVVGQAATGSRTCIYAYSDTTPHWTVNGSGFLGK